MSQSAPIPSTPPRPSGRTTSTLPSTTPAVKKRSSQPPSFLDTDADKAQDEFEKETSGHWVGPFPVNEFMDSFLPWNTIPWTVDCDEKIFEPVPSEGPEPNMYRPLLSQLKKLKFSRLRFYNTSSSPDQESPPYKKWRPDISTYIKGNTPENEKEPSSFYHQVLPLEVKPGLEDPFDDPEENIPAEEREKHKFESERYKKYRGQIAAVFTEMFARRFRTHAFSVFMNTQNARFLRADRSGVLVTRAFNYRSQPHILVEFLFRLDQLRPSQVGIDVTVDQTIPTAESKNYFSSFAAKESASHRDSLRRLSIRVPSGSTTEISEVVAREPLRDPESLISRGTRTFHVFDPSGQRTYFLKDGWRCDATGMEKEQDIIEELRKAGVPRLPIVKNGGDLIDSKSMGSFACNGTWPDDISTDGDSTDSSSVDHSVDDGWHKYHRTVTQKYVEAPWRAGKVAELVPRVHYRFLEEEAGVPLNRFKNSKQLIQVLADVLEALQGAYERCKILHRDVSDNNIMIDKEGRGVLIDWEFAKRAAEPGQESDMVKRQPNRTGTWFFMSSELLSGKNVEHSVQDDIESIFWVLLFIGLRHLHHNILDETDYIIDSIFKEARWNPVRRHYIGGLSKRSFLQGFGEWDFAFENPVPLSTLFVEFRQALAIYHGWLAMAKMPELQTGIKLALAPHEYILRLFAEALQAGDWPVEDDRILPAVDDATSRVEIRVPKKRRTAGPNPSDPSAKRQRSSRAELGKSSRGGSHGAPRTKGSRPGSRRSGFR